ncbi:MAG TPA: glycoside hydrolase family 18 protein [Acidobacteriaceae bacterium]|nr:glycoside hydrolase family 18 protein [Acidobacteriaceae bacterium]
MMRKRAWYLIFAISFLVLAAPLYSAASTSPVIIAYVFPRNRVLQPAEITAQKLTRINYAFALIKDGRMVEGSSADAANFAVLNALKKQNPNLTILVSVGGWLGSGGFSDAALSAHSRKIFIDSVVSFLERYNLDGLDIDWEYPGLPGAGNRFRPEDKQNYTALLRDLRFRFNHEEKKLHRQLYLSVAAGSQTSFLDHTDMRAVARYVDTVNLMCYDYYEPDASATTGMNAPLFTDPADPKQVSADRSVREFEQAGVPASKLVLGVPFYGHEWGQVPAKNNGLYQPGKPVPGAFANYANITATMLNATGQRAGFVRYWDAAAKVPWLYNARTQIFVSYNDPESMRLKAEYVHQHHLAGVMFWEYFADPSGALLDTIDATLLNRNSVSVSTKTGAER